MARRNLSHARVVVTGASSGIGRALVSELARAGAQVFAVARRADRLERLCAECGSLPGKVFPFPGDVTVPETRRQVMHAVSQLWEGLDLLVNNAGVGALGRFDSANPDRLRRVMEVNFFAPAELMRLAIPLLKRGTRPMIVNMSSVLAHRGAPHCAEYCASKAAVRTFSESLRAELAADGVSVLVVCPGTTQTEFFDNVLERTSAPSWPNHAAMTPQTVARRILAAVRSDRREIVPYFWGRMFVLLNRLLPAAAERLMQRFA